MTITGFGNSYANAITSDRQGNLWIGGICAGNGCIFKASPSGGFLVNVGSNGLIAVPAVALGAGDDDDSRRQDPDRRCLQQQRRWPPASAACSRMARLTRSFNGGAMWVWSALRGGR